MTNAKLTKLIAHVTAEVKRKAEIDIADIRNSIPDKIESELVETLSLEDAINSDELSLARIRRAMRQ
jgi:hypothetical protein